MYIVLWYDIKQQDMVQCEIGSKAQACDKTRYVIIYNTIYPLYQIEICTQLLVNFCIRHYRYQSVFYKINMCMKYKVQTFFSCKGLFIIGIVGLVAFKLVIAISSSQHCIFDILSLVYILSYSIFITNFNSSITCTSKLFVNSYYLLQYTILIDCT